MLSAMACLVFAEEKSDGEVLIKVVVWVEVVRSKRAEKLLLLSERDEYVEEE